MARLKLHPFAHGGGTTTVEELDRALWPLCAGVWPDEDASAARRIMIALADGAETDKVWATLRKRGYEPIAGSEPRELEVDGTEPEVDVIIARRLRISRPALDKLRRVLHNLRIGAKTVNFDQPNLYPISDGCEALLSGTALKEDGTKITFRFWVESRDGRHILWGSATKPDTYRVSYPADKVLFEGQVPSPLVGFADNPLAWFVYNVFGPIQAMAVEMVTAKALDGSLKTQVRARPAKNA